MNFTFTGLALAGLLGPGSATAAEAPGPRILIFDAEHPDASPLVILPHPPASAVPKTPLLTVTIGTEEGGRSSKVLVEEKDMILDQAKTAKPGKKKAKAKP